MSPRENKTSNGFKRNLNGLLERGAFAPFLLSVQVVLQSYLINITELKFSDMTRSLGVSFLLAAVVFSMLYFFLRDRLRSALIASFFILFFFRFGDITNSMSTMSGL